MHKPILVALLAAAFALVAVPFAAADDPNGTQYGNPSDGVSTEPVPTTTEPTTTTTEPTTTESVSTEPTTTEPASQVKGETSTSPTATTPSASSPSSDTLPFTGLDLGLALAIGIMAVGGGALLRRAGRKSES